MKHLTICCAFGLFASGVAAADEPFFSGLGHLLGAGYWSDALGISADASTVVGESDYTGYPYWPYQAFRWRANTGIIGLGALLANGASRANGVSGDGSVLAGVSGAPCEYIVVLGGKSAPSA